MCDWKPGARCSCHAALKLAKMRAAYWSAHPDGPLPAPLTGPQTVAAAMADWQYARGEARWAAYAIRVAQNHDDPDVRAAEVDKLTAYQDAALARALRAQEDIDGIRAERQATRDRHLAMHATEVLDDQPEDVAPVIPDGFNGAGFDGIGRHHSGGWRDQHGYDAAGFDRAGFDRAGWNADRRNAVTGTRWSPDHRDQAGYDKSGFDALGFHKNGTLVGPTGETAEQASARRAQTTAPVPAPTPTVVAPQRDRLARYAMWNGRDELVSATAAAELLGVEAEGLAGLTAAGRMPVAVEGDGKGRPRTFTFGSVLDVSGPLPAPPSRVTRAMLQEHTAWQRSEEAARIGAWRVREAARNQAAHAAARVAA